MADSLFFSGRIEEAIAVTVTNRKPLVCFVTDEADDSNVWEQDYLADDAVSSVLKASAVTVRLLKDSTEANYLSAFCTIASFPTLLIIKNGGAGLDGLTVITNPITKEDFVAKIQTTFPSSTSTSSPSLLAGVNSSPSFPDTPSATVPESETPASAASEPAGTGPVTQDEEPSSSPATDSIPENTQFPAESATARRLASIQQQHRERIARLKAQREAAEIEDAKKREIARRSDTKAMNEAAETQKNRSNLKYAQEQKKRKMEADMERKRVLEQIKADREEMRIREANRKAIAMEAEGVVQNESLPVEDKGKGKEPVTGGNCRIAFKLLDGTRISNTFPLDATVEKDLRPWLDTNRTDGSHPYKLVQASGMSSKTIEGNSTLPELGLYPSAILILKPISTSKVTTAFASSARTGGGQQNFIVAFFAGIWLMILTFLGLHNPSASVTVGDEKAGSQATDGASTSTPLKSEGREVRQRIRTLHNGEDGDKRSAYYNGNQLDFEPKKKDEEGGED